MPISDENFPALKARIEAFIDFVSKQDGAHENFHINANYAKGGMLVVKEEMAEEQDFLNQLYASIIEMLNKTVSHVGLIAPDANGRAGSMIVSDNSEEPFKLMHTALAPEKFDGLLREYIKQSVDSDSTYKVEALVELHGLQDVLKAAQASDLIATMRQQGISIPFLAQEMANLPGVNLVELRDQFHTATDEVERALKESLSTKPPVSTAAVRNPDSEIDITAH